jgi:hypothetical protein
MLWKQHALVHTLTVVQQPAACLLDTGLQWGFQAASDSGPAAYRN